MSKRRVIDCADCPSYVLFNRQPSLHKMSMMSHRIKLMNYSSELGSSFMSA